MKQIKDSIYFKIALIGVLILVLLIPATMVKGLITEREQVQSEAVDEVSAKWGKGQTISGPYISIPYDRYEKRRDLEKDEIQIVKIREWIHILPENLNSRPLKRIQHIDFKYIIVIYSCKLMQYFVL